MFWGLLLVDINQGPLVGYTLDEEFALLAGLTHNISLNMRGSTQADKQKQHQWFSGKIHRCHSCSVGNITFYSRFDGPRVRFAADAFIFPIFLNLRSFRFFWGGAHIDNPLNPHS